MFHLIWAVIFIIKFFSVCAKYVSSAPSVQNNLWLGNSILSSITQELLQTYQWRLLQHFSGCHDSSSEQLCFMSVILLQHRTVACLLSDWATATGRMLSSCNRSNILDSKDSFYTNQVIQC